MIYADQKEAESSLQEWQRVLRLQDWDIKIRIVRAKEFVNGDGMGEVRYKHQKQMAVINLLDPIDYDEIHLWEQDHEITMVHELLHIHFMGFEAEEGTEQDNAQERAIDVISKSLVSLRRNDYCA